ncbi:ATP-binding protein [Candidatus Bipolaricaulota bacterium]|nr:ATP-binding protein [Candidatus Bipolaricaulota bacterium]
MRQVLFLSGKGGTGKTSLAAAFAVLAENKVLADCDVDAANLHLLLDPQVIAEGDFEGSKEAVRDASLCTQCGRCREVCRFNAVQENFEIDPYLCEGCGACVTACPANAITLEPLISGRWFNAETKWGPLASAELLPGEETSGKLVMQVKRNMEPLAQSVNAEWALLDGSPGIGCPVIASVSGVDAVILVTEPTLSGMHDLERILGVVNHFRIPAYLVINKADLSADLTERLEHFASEKALPVLGCIPYDRAVTDRLIEGRSVVEDEESPAGAAMRDVFKTFMEATSDL